MPFSGNWVEVRRKRSRKRLRSNLRWRIFRRDRFRKGITGMFRRMTKIPARNASNAGRTANIDDGLDNGAERCHSTRLQNADLTVLPPPTRCIIHRKRIDGDFGMEQGRRADNRETETLSPRLAGQAIGEPKPAAS